jgi:hypothetical protein
MIWTIKTPTKPGWYWFQPHNMKPRVIELIAEHEPPRLLIAESSTRVDDFESSMYRWAGPLELPEEQ